MKVEVNVRSTHIIVKYEFDDSDLQIDMEEFIKEFAEEIEKITFENLKVTYHEIVKNKYGSNVEIYIANAYEVIE